MRACVCVCVRMCVCVCDKQRECVVEAKAQAQLPPTNLIKERLNLFKLRIVCLCQSPVRTQQATSQPHSPSKFTFGHRLNFPPAFTPPTPNNRQAPGTNMIQAETAFWESGSRLMVSADKKLMACSHSKSGGVSVSVCVCLCMPV